VKRYIGGVDAGLMAGEFEDVTKLGFDGSGSVIGTGWRTEWVWSDPDASDSYWQGVADLNWSFRSGLSLAVEYFTTVVPFRSPPLARKRWFLHSRSMPAAITPAY